MAADNKNNRSPKDLPVPETMKIAALLAELMPPGAQGSKAVTIPASGAGDDGSGASLVPPALEIEDLDDLEPIVPPPIPPVPVEPKATVPGIQPKPNAINPEPTPMRPPPVPKITATVVPAAPPKPVSPPPPPAPKVEAPPLPKLESPPPPKVEAPPPLPPTPVPPPVPKAATAGDVMGRANWKGTPEPPKPAATPLDPELIPIGNLSAEGYFSLVNWRNEAERVRHPRRADYGLDEQTIALARKNPFYVLGQPRRPERATVSEVLAEIDW